MGSYMEEKWKELVLSGVRGNTWGEGKGLRVTVGEGKDVDEYTC